MKLRTSFSLLIFVAILVGVSASLLLGIIPLRSYMQQRFFTEVEDILTAAKGGVEVEIARGWEASLSLARHFGLIDWFTGGEADEELGIKLKDTMVELAGRTGFKTSFAANSYTNHYWVGHTLMDTLATTDPDDGWFFGTLQSSQELQLNLDYNASSQETNLWFNALVFADARVIGVAGIGISIDQVIEDFIAAKPSAGSDLYLIDPAGKVLVSSDAAANANDIGLYIPADASLLPDTSLRQFSSGGELYLTTTMPVWTTDYQIILRARIADFVPSFWDIGGRSIIFTLVFSLGIGLASIFIVRAALGSLKHMSVAFSGIACGEGDLTACLDEGHDEVGAVSKDFNLFIGNLRQIISKVKEAIDRSMGLNLELVSSSQESSAAVTEISANIDSISHQVNALDAVVKRSEDTFRTMFGAIDVLDGRIDEQAGMVEESTAAIVEMKASLVNISEMAQKRMILVQNLNSISKDGGRSLEETETIFSKEIADKMNSIIEMNQIVAQVASQTNLLAMNAAIEAAHAGDSGKGFAVVAEEIRRLAEATAENAANISNIIGGMQKGIDKTSGSVHGTMEAFSAIDGEVTSVGQTFSEMVGALGEIAIGGDHIMVAMNRLNSFTGEVRAAATALTDGGHSVHREFDTIATLSGEINNGITEIAQGTSEIRDAMQLLRDMNSRFADQFRMIADETERFKLV